jgi:butyrate kinase
MNGTSPVHTILVINPGSSSTKIALYLDTVEKARETVPHRAETLAHFPFISSQVEFRLGFVRAFLEKNPAASLDAIAVRGGLMRPLASGIYRVTTPLLDDLRNARFGEHAANLGALCAAPLAKTYGCPVFTADPVVVDEMDLVAKISGIPEITRRSLFHALNQKSAAREIAARQGKKYEEANFIVAHLGGGISVGAHCRGRVVDVNNAFDGDGPFSPERAGGVPSGDLLRLFASHQGPIEHLHKKLVGRGGLVAHCATNNLEEIMEKIKNGDDHAALVFQAMALQISKEIAMHGATLKGNVDAVILTGGLAHNRELVDAIAQRVAFLGPLEVLPGEREMETLARAALSVLNNEQEALNY